MENVIVGMCFLIVMSFFFSIAVSFYNMTKKTVTFKARWKKAEEKNDYAEKDKLLKEYNLTVAFNKTPAEAHNDKLLKDINQSASLWRNFSIVATIIAIVIKASGWMILWGIIIAFPFQVVIMFIAGFLGAMTYKLTNKKDNSFESIS